MPNKTSDYYFKSANTLGWGEQTLKPDKERKDLLIKFVSGEKVLDIGCGYGVYVDFLASNGYQAFGVDFVSEFIEQAGKTKKGTFMQGNAEKLPFPDKSFDTCLLFDILEHGDDVMLLKEAKRITKEKILIIVPRLVDKKLEQSGVIFRHYLDKSHLREYSMEDINALAKKVGMEVVFMKEVHLLYNETIFLALFSGPMFFKKIIRKIVFLLLPKSLYPTEIFAVLKR